MTIPLGDVSDDNNIAGILKRLLLDSGVSTNDLVLADIDQLDADAGYTVGDYRSRHRLTARQ